jgi:hypothetical protein
MPGHNFMLADIAGFLLAVAIFPLFIFVPGYAAGWLLDLWAFRRRSALFRAALSVTLSVALCPILTYLAGRFGSMTAVWLMYGAAAAYFAAVLPSVPPCGLPWPSIR